jgi:hypothetical protein
MKTALETWRATAPSESDRRVSTMGVAITAAILIPISVVMGLGGVFVGGIWRPSALRSWAFARNSLTSVVAIGFLAIAMFDFRPSIISIAVTIGCIAVALATSMVGHVVAMSEFGASVAERLDVDGFVRVFDRARE